MILITGSAGFIGFHLSLRLLKEGYDVVGIDNMNNYYDPKLKEDRNSVLSEFPNYHFHRIDIKDKTSVADIFERYQPEYVVHLAAQAGVRYSLINPDAYIESNIIGFYNILEACKVYKPKHLIFASSSSVYGNSQDLPFSVKDRADKPVSLYAATKRSNELFAYVYSYTYNIPTTGLRFFTVYGPWGRPDMAYFKFTKSILEDGQVELYNNGTVKRDFTFIDDAIECLRRLIDKIPTDVVPYKIYNVGSGQPITVEELVKTLEKIIGKKAKRVYKELPSADVLVTYADTTELEEEINFSPITPLEEGLRRFYEWYKMYYDKHPV